MNDHLQRLLAQARAKGDLAAIKFYENALSTPVEDEPQPYTIDTTPVYRGPDGKYIQRKGLPE